MSIDNTSVTHFFKITSAILILVVIFGLCRH